jgi:hypothetical protein
MTGVPGRPVHLVPRQLGDSQLKQDQGLRDRNGLQEHILPGTLSVGGVAWQATVVLVKSPTAQSILLHAVKPRASGKFPGGPMLVGMKPGRLLGEP